MNRHQTRLTLTMITLVAAALVGAIAAPHSHRHRPITWQQSESPMIKLGVRDKFGDLEKYSAVFTVTGQDGKKLHVEKKVTGDSWGDVSYPDDFSLGDYVGTGSYKWQCTVNGKVVTSGTFKVTHAADGQRLTINTK